jgi:hypothetical protein
MVPPDQAVLAGFGMGFQDTALRMLCLQMLTDGKTTSCGL